MKILSASQIRALDKQTIAEQNISSADLMERASQAFVKWITQKFTSKNRVLIFCGIGNNGGDGLVIGRLLHQLDYKVQLYVVRFSKNQSQDFQINYQRFEEFGSIGEIEKENQIPTIPSNTLVIDAIFGSGLSRPAEGIAKQVIQKINASEVAIISVDIASGLYCDAYCDSEVIIRPEWTVSFQLPKLSFMFPQNEGFVGNWDIVDIQLSQEQIDKTETLQFYIDKALAKSILKKRRKFSHKGTYGHVLNIGGSYGKIGAMILANKASIRAGAGLTTTYIPHCGYEIMQTAVPEVMCLTDANQTNISNIPKSKDYDAISIGVGMDTRNISYKPLKALFKSSPAPLVIDADALNLISQKPEILDKIPPLSILTPHPKEFERLVGFVPNQYNRLEVQRKFSKKYNVIVVLKGAHTCISMPNGDVYFNSTGNSGMATGGSGDVLTGIIAALLAQKYSPKEAAILGVYLHGLAGDLAKEQVGEESLIAHDLIAYLGQAFQFLKN